MDSLNAQLAHAGAAGSSSARPSLCSWLCGAQFCGVIPGSRHRICDCATPERKLRACGQNRFVMAFMHSRSGTCVAVAVAVKQDINEL